MTIGGMLLVNIPIFVAHLFGSEIRPRLVTANTDHIVSIAFYIYFSLTCNRCAQDLIYSTMGFVLFLTAGILSLEFYVIYRNAGKFR